MNRKFRRALIIITLPLIFSTSCSGGLGDTDDFGYPPTPESCFCDPEGVETYLKWLWSEYPEYTDLRIIGSSENDAPIFVLEISDNPAYSENEPSVLLNGGVHGNEQLSTGICLLSAQYILSVYASYQEPDNAENPYSETEMIDVAYLVENFRIHIMPALNPDGLASGNRLNSNYVDLNRNFGYNWYEEESNNGSSPFDQAESAAVRDDFIEQGYCLAINFHTAAFNSNIGIYAPWDAIPSDDPDFIETYLPNYLMIESLGSEYADTVSQGSYPFNQFFHYDEGGDWYTMNGSMADWAMGTQAAVSYSIEIYGEQNFTTDDADLLDTVWNTHKPALLKLIKSAELGSGGIVVSGSSPVKDALISFDYTGISKGFVAAEYSALTGNSAADGSFRFLTGEGSYHVTISKSDYQTVEFDVDVNESGLTSIEGGAYEYFPDYSLPES